MRLEAGKTYTCTVTNALRTSALEWTKTDEAGQALNGSTWKLSRTSAPEVGEIPVTPGKGGAFKVDGLPMGTYRLTETAAPAGFRKLAAPIDITIDEDEKVRGLPEDGKIRNAALQTPVLPLTGGAGSDAFLIAGSAFLILCAGALWIAQRRRKHRDA
ncbi:SpaA isopeptide-forming pilin-related protein [Schaalia hyovaginalis]|uniref:SpaA isopeptide-forming pilin-related protein n=1 Tax=Schaalia hyovaginalis TaxID=29316 RepID=UPI0031B5F7DB